MKGDWKNLKVNLKERSVGTTGDWCGYERPFHYKNQHYFIKRKFSFRQCVQKKSQIEKVKYLIDD